MDGWTSLPSRKVDGAAVRTMGVFAAPARDAVASEKKLTPSPARTVRRDGATWEQIFKQGKPQGPLKRTGPARGTGTTVSFHPDPAIFPRICFSELTELRGDTGARMVLERNSYRLVRVPMSNAAIDLDTPEDLAALTERFRIEKEE